MESNCSRPGATGTYLRGVTASRARGRFPSPDLAGAKLLLDPRSLRRCRFISRWQSSRVRLTYEEISSTSSGRHGVPPSLAALHWGCKHAAQTGTRADAKLGTAFRRWIVRLRADDPPPTAQVIERRSAGSNTAKAWARTISLIFFSSPSRTRHLSPVPAGGGPPVWRILLPQNRGKRSDHNPSLYPGRFLQLIPIALYSPLTTLKIPCYHRNDADTMERSCAASAPRTKFVAPRS